MTNSVSKIYIKIGMMEVDYEGDPDFLNDGIEKLLEKMGQLAKENMFYQDSAFTKIDVVEKDFTSSDSGQKTKQLVSSNKIEFTTSMLASHSGATTAVELALCAMAFLELNKGTKPNERSAILSEMKTVSSVYNTQMSKNNAINLKRLAKNKRINDLGSYKYALTKEEIIRFEEIIAKFD